MKKIITLVFVFVCTGSSASAARLYFEPALVEMRTGNEARVDLMLDPEGESVNALELALNFPSKLVSFRSALTGESIVSMWIERPRASGDSLNLAGIMPGGFSGVIEAQTENLLAGPVASFVFLPTKEGSGRLEIIKAKLILNDGRGTEIEPTLAEANFAVIGVATTTIEAYDINDTLPPENFWPVVIKSKAVNQGLYSLVFDAADRGSGIDHYEVREGDGEFRRAVSPHPLADQTLSSIIYVRAIDVAGNERTVLVEASNGPSAFPKSGLMDIVFAVVAVVLLSILWYTRGKHHP